MLQLSKIDWQKSIFVIGGAVVLLVAVLGYFGWRHYRRNDPLKNLKPGIYQTPSRNSGDTLPLPPAKR